MFQDPSNSICLPLIWCKRDDIELKTEVVALFKEFSLPLNNLLYKCDFENLKYGLHDKNVKVSLVDHNHGREHTELNEFVIEIIGKVD